MGNWDPASAPRYPAILPEEPNAQPEEGTGEGFELDLMRRSYVNLTYECGELEALVAYIRTSNAPFTARDLHRLDEAAATMRAGLRAVRKVVKHERRWSPDGDLTLAPKH